ncbi:argininosuccinate lyase [Phlyctema vagabunda]|uniref:Arginosuccinase n=1 Tax=Phlyctema vagabunda TaxID=108571 RepID=A0ABR4P1P9_9HELO
MPLRSFNAKVRNERDTFFWLCEINKASAVINADEGLLERTLAPRIAQGLQILIQEGGRPKGKRPHLVITFEPLLIEVAGLEATSLHAGRSSQDILTTASTAIIREETLRLAEQLLKTTARMVALSEEHVTTIVPNYTNGVAAQPNSYGHYLLGHVAGLQRDAERLRQFYVRLDRCAMGTTVLNGSSWPLNRDRMASYLGFSATVDNAYDAAQISASEMPVELGGIATAIALHTGSFIQNIMLQYSQPRPWILLREGGDNTYVSSAMPQKRNPGLLNRTRANASHIITLSMGRAIQGHNIPPGMPDAKGSKDSCEILTGTTRILADWEQILDSLDISPSRALEELNLDWTASQELADVLLREHKLPFRVGHHFASEIVNYAKKHNICPSEFSYLKAQEIYSKTLEDMKVPGGELPMSEATFSTTLDPVSIIRNRATAGGPQPVEMERMLKAAKESLDAQRQWIGERQEHINGSLLRLENDFKCLLV